MAIKGSANAINGVLGMLNSPWIGVNPIQIFEDSMAASRVEYYTVPAGKKALVASFASAMVFNPTGGGLTVTLELKIGATYYVIANATAVAAGALVLITSNNGISLILEAGDTICMTASGTGMAMWFRPIEVDAASPVKCVRLTSLASGDNTIYECPANYKGLILRSGYEVGIAYPFGTGGNAVLYQNNSGGARSVYLKFHPNGGSAIQITPSASVNDFSGTIFACSPPTMVAGDKLIINTNAATAAQLVMLNVLEIPA